MHTIVLAIVIALAGLVMIASGALQLSMLEAAEGEMLQMSDYLSEIGTLASGLGMLGLAEVLRLLLYRLTLGRFEGDGRDDRLLVRRPCDRAAGDGYCRGIDLYVAR
jgi:hypothetical protein